MVSPWIQGGEVPDMNTLLQIFPEVTGLRTSGARRTDINETQAGL